MNLPTRSTFTNRWKAILVTLVIGATSFTIGSYANPVIVQQVRSIGGSHVTVPAPEVQVLDTVWDLDLNNSVVSSLTLTVTTTGGSGATGSKLYLVEVQVSCLIGTAITPNCARGATIVKLPVNMNGVSVPIPVSISPAIDPELIEIDDLSFIVTGLPNATADACLKKPGPFSIFTYCWFPITPCERPDFSLFSNSTQTDPATGSSGVTLTLPPPSSPPNSVSVNKIVQSLQCYTGNVTLSAIVIPPVNIPTDLAVAFATNPVPVIIPNGAVSSTETISTCAPPLVLPCLAPTVPGVHTIVNFGKDGVHTHIFIFTVNVV